MMEILVGITRGSNLDAVSENIRDVRGVLAITRFANLKSILMVDVEEDFDEAGLMFLAGVAGWNPADGEMRIATQVDTTVAMPIRAIGSPPETARYMQYQSAEAVSAKKIKKWWEFPRDVTITEETERLGSNVVICIMDTGIDATHDEFTNLPNRIERIWDLGDGNNGTHGTYTASEAAGATCGFLREAKILDAKVFNGLTGSGGVGNGVLAIDTLISWVENPANGVTDNTIVILSMSFSEVTTFIVNSYKEIMTELLERGIFPFAATGNNLADLDGLTNAWPAEDLRWSAVGATDMGGRRAFFSNYGDFVRLYGYGLHVPSANAGTGNGLAWPSGTSMATPNAAGAFGTWMSGRYRPSGLDDTEAALEEYLKSFCYKNLVYDDRGVSLPNPNYFARADNSPVVNHVRADSYEVAIYYGTAPSVPDLQVTNDPSVLGGSRDRTAGRFNAAYSESATILNGEQGPRISLLGENDIWVQFTIYRDSAWTINLDGQWLTIPFTTGDVWIEIDALGFNNLQMAQYAAPAGALTNTAIAEIATNTLAVIDVHIVKDDPLNAGNAIYELFVNGVSVYSFSGTRGGGVVGDFINLSGFRWNYTYYLSNLRVSTESTLSKPFRIENLKTVGNYDEFLGAGFAGLTDRNTNFHAYGPVDGARVGGTLDFDFIPDNGAISAIALAVLSRAEGPRVTLENLGHFVRIGGADYDQTPATPGRSRAQVVTTMLTNPATAAAWAYADLQFTEFGLVATGPPAQPTITNGGFETGTLSGWTVTSGNMVVSNGSEYSDNANSARTGTSMVFQNVSSGGVIEQVINVSNWASVIDAGNATFTLEAYLITDIADQGRLTLQPLTAADADIGAGTIGVYTVNNSTSWLKLTVTMVLPVDTRKVTVGLDGLKSGAGSVCQAYFDDVAVSMG
jgi:hypothetical protein